VDRLIKLIRKYLESQPHVEDGFEYQFVSVELDDFIVDCTVNVILPKKGQSFLVEKFAHDIENIMLFVSQLIGEKITYSVKILVEGKLVPNNGLYINPEDSDEIIRRINENIKYVMVSNSNERNKVGANISFSRTRRGEFYSLDSYQYIDIFLVYKLQNIKVNNEPVEINLRKIDVFADVFNQKLQDEDSFKNKLIEILYQILEPSLKNEDVEIYINPQYWIVSVEGIETDGDGETIERGFSDDMFIQTS
jgi:hypothetical protein